MPCQGPPDPTIAERETYKVARLLIPVLKYLGEEVEELLYGAAHSEYGYSTYLHAWTDMLCSRLRKLKPAQRKQLLDWNKKSCRPLATWWEDHKQLDRAREADERKAEREQAMRKRAVAKLTKAERRLLGV